MLPDLLPEHLLARFVLDRQHLRATPPHIKPRAFLPRYDENAGEPALSTFRIDGLAEADIWEVGAQHIEARVGRRLKARADVPAQAYQDVGLKTVFDDTPPRHVNVLGWPLEAEKQLELALELVAAVKENNGFHKRPLSGQT